MQPFYVTPHLSWWSCALVWYPPLPWLLEVCCWDSQKGNTDIPQILTNVYFWYTFVVSDLCLLMTTSNNNTILRPSFHNGPFTPLTAAAALGLISKKNPGHGAWWQFPQASNAQPAESEIITKDNQTRKQTNTLPESCSVLPPTSSCGKTNNLGPHRRRSLPCSSLLTEPDVFLSSKCLFVGLSEACLCVLSQDNLTRITITGTECGANIFTGPSPPPPNKHTHITAFGA